MNKKRYRSIGIIIICALLIIIFVNIGFRNIFKCDVTDITIHNILEYPNGTMSVDYFLGNFSQDFGLDKDIQKDIRLEPQKYKIVNIKFKVSNIYKFIGVRHVEINPKYDLKLLKMIIGRINITQSDDTPITLKINQYSGARFELIVKADSESEDEILKYVKNSNFLLD